MSFYHTKYDGLGVPYLFHVKCKFSGVGHGRGRELPASMSPGARCVASSVIYFENSCLIDEIVNMNRLEESTACCMLLGVVGYIYIDLE